MNKLIQLAALILTIGVSAWVLASITRPARAIKPWQVSEQAYKTVSMEVTAYCPCVECCGRWADGHFADGSHVGGKAIAADTRYYPMGTVLNVPGYGQAVVKDRGGAIKGANRLDLYFSTHQAALVWGRKHNVNVRIVK